MLRILLETKLQIGTCKDDFKFNVKLHCLLVSTISTYKQLKLEKLKKSPYELSVRQDLAHRLYRQEEICC